MMRGVTLPLLPSLVSVPDRLVSLLVISLCGHSFGNLLVARPYTQRTPS